MVHTFLENIWPNVTEMGKLNALAVKNAPSGKRLSDGRGLFLDVGKSGLKQWILRIQVAKKRHEVWLGDAVNVSLAEARTQAEEVRKAYREGRDPIAERKTDNKNIPTFRQAALMVHKEHSPGWKNKKHAAQWLQTLETYVFPKFGKLPVNEIEGPMVRDVLAEIWLTIPETARRVRQRIGTVLDFAHAKGWREFEAPMRSVSKGLPKQQKTSEHFAAMDWREVPAFISNIGDSLKTGETVRLALEFLILTAARSGEVRGATWQEFDIGKAAWTIPAERMKGQKLHRVPLPGRAIQILARMKELRRHDSIETHVFEGTKPGKPLSDMSLTMPLRRAGLTVTVHGFRSAFRDWAGEATNTPRDVAEACLAHAFKSKVEAAYNRSDYFDKRRKVMESWAIYVGNGNGEVVPMSRAGG